MSASSSRAVVDRPPHIPTALRRRCSFRHRRLITTQPPRPLGRSSGPPRNAAGRATTVRAPALSLGGRAAGRAGVRRVNISGTINQRHVKRDTRTQTPTETRTDRYTQTDRRPDAGAINLVSSSGPAPSARVGGCR